MGFSIPRNYVDLKGYEGRYMINKKGCIYSLLTNKVLIPYENNSGYLYVDLRKDNKTHRHYIHRLMGYNFLDLPENLQINHKNKVRTDNKLKNLEVVTRKENDRHKHIGKKRGVYWCKPRNVFHAYLWTDGVNRFLGSFKTKEDAYKIYYKAYKEKYGVKPW
jgi:hypothetical protein